jgi:hypothetical protein
MIADVVALYGTGNMAMSMTMIRSGLLAVALSCASVTALAAGPLPSFERDVPYGTVRNALLAQGWQPVRLPDADRCGPRDSRCQGRPEMTSCSGTGRAPCLFTWRKDARTIEVVTEFEDGGFFRSLRCVEGCG